MSARTKEISATVPSVRTLLSAVLGAALLAGCPRPPTPPPVDSGPPPSEDAGPPPVDAGPLVREDTDGDGLCDDTEITFGTDPEARDSDSDGFTDRVERDLGYAPLVPDSPDDLILVFMDAEAGASAQFPLSFQVRGDGETYTGAFNSLPVVDELGLDAFAFYDSGRAVGAAPPDNVTEVRVEDQTYVAVFGRTTLQFELRFEFGDNVERGCAQAYPFRYDVKRDDGAIVFVGRYLLVVVPPDIPLAAAPWCVESGECI